jgi:hypothetical protein
MELHDPGRGGSAAANCLASRSTVTNGPDGPEGSGCSVGFGTGLDVYAGEPGSHILTDLGEDAFARV